MEILMDNMVYLLPVILLEAALGLTALIHVLRHPHYKYGNQLIWSFIVVVIGFIGPILYFLTGKGDEE